MLCAFAKGFFRKTFIFLVCRWINTHIQGCITAFSLRQTGVNPVKRREIPQLEENSPKSKLFGIDPNSGEIILGKYRISMPKSRIARIALGIALILGGIFSFCRSSAFGCCH